MSAPAPASGHRPIAPALLLLITLAAIAGLSAVWAAAAVMLDSNAAWMAPVAALDAAILLRLAGHPGGARRAHSTLAITLLTVLAAAVLVAAAKVGLGLGMRPAEALGRMSFELVLLYVHANVGWIDGLWAAAAAATAWLGGR